MKYDSTEPRIGDIHYWLLAQHAFALAPARQKLPLRRQYSYRQHKWTVLNMQVIHVRRWRRELMISWLRPGRKWSTYMDRILQECTTTTELMRVLNPPGLPCSTTHHSLG